MEVAKKTPRKQETQRAQVTETIDLSSDEETTPTTQVEPKTNTKHGHERAQYSKMREVKTKPYDPRLRTETTRRGGNTTKKKALQTKAEDNSQKVQKNVLKRLIPINRDNACAASTTKKHLTKHLQHQDRQNAIARSAPKQDKERMANRLNTHMEVIILPNGGPGLVRKKGIDFKPVHGEEYMSEQDVDKKREKLKTKKRKERYIPPGQSDIRKILNESISVKNS